MAFALMAAPACADDELAAKIEKLTSSHQEKLAEFSKKIQAAPAEKRGEIYQKEYPDATEVIAALTEIIKAEPADEASLEAISWIAKNSRGAIDGTLFGILEEHHLNSENLVPVISAMMRIATPESNQFLRTVSTKSEVKDARGMAIFTLASAIERDSSKQDEYIELIETLVKDYPDLSIRGRNLAKMAEGKLFAAKNLGIGKEAPEIIGKDVDGKEMKLSDYRGKVVVIDFWGDW